jgi:hypothetical protein
MVRRSARRCSTALPHHSEMKIGIIGSGNVGGTLGTRWAQAGHEVTFGSRDPSADAMKQLVARAGGIARSATLADAARASEVLLLATPWSATKEVLQGLGELGGKVLIEKYPARPIRGQARSFRGDRWIVFSGFPVRKFVACPRIGRTTIFATDSQAVYFRAHSHMS